MEQPESIYIERGVGAKREFRLSASALEISSPEGTIRIDLDTLRPTPRNGKVIDGTTKRRLWVAGTALILLYFIVPLIQPYVVALVRELVPSRVFAVVKVSYLVLALALSAAGLFWRRYHDFVEFEYEPGRTAFDVMKARTNDQDFVSFVDAISRNIHAITSSRLVEKSADSP